MRAAALLLLVWLPGYSSTSVGAVVSQYYCCIVTAGLSPRSFRYQVRAACFSTQLRARLVSSCFVRVGAAVIY